MPLDENDVTKQLLKNTQKIAAHDEILKYIQHRLDENDRITEGIHKLASNVESLTLQVKLLTESMETSISRLETGQRSQGERIGALENAPGTRWKDLTKQVIGLVVAAAVGLLLAKLM